MNNIQTFENLSEISTGDGNVMEIFSNTKQLYSMHKQFLEALQTQVQTYPNKITIGEDIKSFTPKLKAYNYYLSHYSKAMNALDIVSKKTAFKNFLKSVNTKKSLRDLLSAPLDRVSNYLISFKKLSESCPPNHPILRYLNEAVNNLNTESNEFSKSSTISFNIGTILPVWNILSGYPGELLVGHRILRHKGSLNFFFIFLICFYFFYLFLFYFYFYLSFIFFTSYFFFNFFSQKKKQKGTCYKLTETTEKVTKEEFVYFLFSDGK